MNSQFPRHRPEMFLPSESAADRDGRLAELAQRIGDGEYEVSPDIVAESVVAFFRRDFVPREPGNPGSGHNTC